MTPRPFKQGLVPLVPRGLKGDGEILLVLTLLHTLQSMYFYALCIK